MTTLARTRRKIPWKILIGPLLLVILLWQVDFQALARILQRANGLLFVFAMTLNIPLILLKSLRWQGLMLSQHIRYPTGQAYLAYHGSVFIGFLTPGRLGEFVKSFHVSRDCHVPVGQAFASVLVDRIFDLYLLLIVGGFALLTLPTWHTGNTLLPLLGGLLFLVPVLMFLHDGIFAVVRRLGLRLGKAGRWLFAPEGWLLQLRGGLQQISVGWLLLAMVLTIISYGLFFGQCSLLAWALGMEIGFVQVSFAVALGSLISLLPISIAGLGTRETAVIAYLGTMGFPAAFALGFSLLMFANFHVINGLMGAVAWWIKPLPLEELRGAHHTHTAGDA